MVKAIDNNVRLVGSSLSNCFLWRDFHKEFSRKIFPPDRRKFKLDISYLCFLSNLVLWEKI